MAKTSSRRTRPAPVEQTPITDPITEAHTVMIHRRLSGTVAVTVGVWDRNTKKYWFVRLPDQAYGPVGRAPLSRMVALAAQLIAGDPELGPR